MVMQIVVVTCADHFYNYLTVSILSVIVTKIRSNKSIFLEMEDFSKSIGVISYLCREASKIYRYSVTKIPRNEEKERENIFLQSHKMYSGLFIQVLIKFFKTAPSM